ncbi:MAG: large-conductance mechanosensitive channel protein MscL [Deltaproteobacteria bacterium]|nr:large-conductance mechanosensitive channel protein MscL [Deltaproteobacteria bacterium]
MFKEFKEFAIKGNMLDMAVGIILGAAFGTIVKSLVADIIMPPIGLALGNIDFSNLYILLKNGNPIGPYLSLEAANKAGAVTLNYGTFINGVLSFFIIAFSTFILVRSFNRLRRQKEVEEEKTTQTCPECQSEISIKAKRCAFCTSQLS